MSKQHAFQNNSRQSTHMLRHQTQPLNHSTTQPTTTVNTTQSTCNLTTATAHSINMQLDNSNNQQPHPHIPTLTHPHTSTSPHSVSPTPTHWTPKDREALAGQSLPGVQSHMSTSTAPTKGWSDSRPSRGHVAMTTITHSVSQSVSQSVSTNKHEAHQAKAHQTKAHQSTQTWNMLFWSNSQRQPTMTTCHTRPGRAQKFRVRLASVEGKIERERERETHTYIIAV